MVGPKLSYADVALFDCVRETLNFRGIDEKHELQDLPLLREWLQRMEELPSIRAYLSERGSAIDNIVSKFL